MTVDLLIAEIGSTTTVVTAFDKINTEKPIVVGQGEHYTTVFEGDVTIGIERAIKEIEKKLNINLKWNKFLASSSAAGGLKMTVHGLVYDMTVKAAKEAALGAGAVLKYATAGKMRKTHLENILAIEPKLILLAGGVDYGEEETVLHNAELINELPIDVPVIYSGNCAVADEVKNILKDKKVIITENVYPKVDQLNVKPARMAIQEVFSEHIIHAPGMEKIQNMTDDEIIPTPGAVMLTTELLAEMYEDVLTVDIGGATTDVDSVTEGDPKVQKIMLAPEPISKRTVEGDMGLFVNAHNVLDMIGEEEIKKEFSDYEELKKNLSPYPKTERQEKFAAFIAKYCFTNGIRRHAGRKKHLYGPNGRQEIASGKDLTAVKHIFGTGGILTRSKFRKEIMESFLEANFPNELLPNKKVKFAYDKNYIFAALGVLSTVDKETAKKILEIDIESI
ncbi:ornithine aminomutase [Tepiditoga spiralis]|uniref:Ornithine aminomutase n=1 Tax=Tepiditoga spiralis TaxID=2108365 RepID=A0A7G1GBY7_9BACT|nr:GlmL-related ornithine degradation protein [Tepiditoga spiralis]BBE32092.1 ornithine aminomutase [Tepiditoga spiralis]